MAVKEDNAAAYTDANRGLRSARAAWRRTVGRRRECAGGRPTVRQVLRAGAEGADRAPQLSGLRSRAATAAKREAEQAPETRREEAQAQRPRPQPYARRIAGSSRQ